MWKRRIRQRLNGGNDQRGSRLRFAGRLGSDRRFDFLPCFGGRRV
jgi:hypothetical protein